MIPLIITGLIIAVGFDKIFLAPRRWMRKHSAGNYSPLRQFYANAHERAKAERRAQDKLNGQNS